MKTSPLPESPAPPPQQDLDRWRRWLREARPWLETAVRVGVLLWESTHR